MQPRSPGPGRCSARSTTSPPSACLGLPPPRGRPVCRRVLLYQALTGRLPFEGDLPTVVAAQHRNADPPAPSAAHPGLGTGLDGLVLRALAKEPAGHHPSAAAMRAEVRLYEAGTDPDAPTYQVLPRRAAGVMRERTKVQGKARAPHCGRYARPGCGDSHQAQHRSTHRRSGAGASKRTAGGTTPPVPSERGMSSLLAAHFGV